MLHPLARAVLSHPVIRAQIEAALAARGRGGDDHIVHVNDAEMARLKAWGGSGTINPKTGLREFKDGGSDIGNGGGPGGGVAAGGGNGGYGNGGDGHSSVGSGGGAGGGHTGNNHTVDNPPGQPVIEYQPPPNPPPPVTLPPPPPAAIATTPLMSQTAATNLIGSRFGALPAWATQSYQIGDVPTSFPVSGQPFDTVPGQPIPPPPPPPPTTGGGGNPGGGGVVTPGHPFGGDGTGGLNSWNTPGGHPTVQPPPTPPTLTPTQTHILTSLGVTPGAHPITHQTPGFQDQGSLTPILKPAQNQTPQNLALMASLGVTPKPQAPTPAPTTGLSATQQGILKSLGVTPKPAAQPHIAAALSANTPKVTSAGTPVAKTAQAPAGSLTHLMSMAKPQATTKKKVTTAAGKKDR